MPTNLNPYIAFRGEAADAMAFYQSVLGGELTSSTFAEFGMPVGPGEENQLMHSQLVTAGGLVLMGADTPASMEYSTGSQITISVSGQDVDELRGWFEGLAEGGTITLPLEQAPWGDYFGQLTDRYGIPWMFNIGGTPQEPTAQ